MANFLSPWERRNGVRVLITSDALQRVVGTDLGASTSSTPASRPDYSSSRLHSSSPTATALGSPFTYRGSYGVASSRYGSLSPYEHRTTSDYPSTSTSVPSPSGFQDHPARDLSPDRWTSTTPNHGGHLDLSTSAHSTRTQPTPPPRGPSPPWWSSLPLYLHPSVSSDTDQPYTSTSAVGSATSTAARGRSPLRRPPHTPPYQTGFASAFDSFAYCDDEGGGTNYTGSTLRTGYRSGSRHGGSGGSSHGGGARGGGGRRTSAGYSSSSSSSSRRRRRRRRKRRRMDSDLVQTGTGRDSELDSGSEGRGSEAGY
ncbi:hypothetical protein VTG60DRAFT_3500 [Thermothelomyces hinnuleus]